MSAAVVHLDRVSRVHGRGEQRVVALCDAELMLGPGEFVAVMGASGSGKSTLLHLAGGLDRPTSGRVTVDGTDLAGLSTARLARLRRRSVGYVFQDYNLLPTLTAVENVAFPLELDGMFTRRARGVALAALRDIGLEEIADRRPDRLSGGQAQRVAIARALVGSRRLILADEPTGALDSSTGRTILELLRHRADEGAAVLMVTHEARFAAWADRTVFIRDGRVVDETGPSDPARLLVTDAGLA